MNWFVNANLHELKFFDRTNHVQTDTQLSQEQQQPSTSSFIDLAKKLRDQKEHYAA